MLSKYWGEACLLNDVINWSHTIAIRMKDASKRMWPIDHKKTDMYLPNTEVKHACKIMWTIEHIKTDMFGQNTQGKHACLMMWWFDHIGIQGDEAYLQMM